MSHGACQVGVSGHEPAFTSAGTFQIAQTVDIAFCVDEVQARTVCLASAVVAAGLPAPPVLIPGTTQRHRSCLIVLPIRKSSSQAGFSVRLR